MAKTSPRQRKTIGRVMHEYEHGELSRGPDGKGGKVKNRRQAVAIALSEAGASNQQSDEENRRRLQKTKRKEARGETAQQEHEGKSHVGARGRRESSPAMAGENARRTTGRGRNSSGGRKRQGRGSAGNDTTKAELYRRAKKRDIPGRSKMSKSELSKALGRK